MSLVHEKAAAEGWSSRFGRKQDRIVRRHEEFCSGLLLGFGAIAVILAAIILFLGVKIAQIQHTDCPIPGSVRGETK